jgi:hypothetical protein
MSRKISFMRAVTAIAAVTALGQDGSRASGRCLPAAYAMLAPAALVALTFGMIDADRLGAPKVSTVWLSAMVVLAWLWRRRPAHPPAKLRFLHGPRSLTGAGIELIGPRGVLLHPMPAAQHVTARTRTSFFAAVSPAKQPPFEEYEYLARLQADSDSSTTPTTNASRPWALTAELAVIAGMPASLSGLPQRLSPSVA